MNTMSFSQAATVLNEIVKQATGQQTIQPINTPADFVAVAQKALLTGYDPVLNAISQVWSRTIFSSRDYNAPLNSLYMDAPRFGNAVRKLSPVAREMTDDERYKYPVAYDAVGHSQNPLGNGESVDMFKISKQDVQQTNFYGTAVYQQDFTVFRDQFDAAFSSAEEFGRFNAMMMTERQNDRESYKESIARGLQANYIGSILAEGQNDRVIHLLTEYNAQTGLSLTAQTVYQPGNFKPFMSWVYARIRIIAKLFRNRSNMFQTVIDGKAILRHTPANKLRIALYSEAMEQMNALVLADSYHDAYLKYANYDSVDYWQNIETRDSISIKPVYTGTSGQVVQASNETEQAGIFGLIHDVDAIGYSSVNDWSAISPFNTKGAYWNHTFHSTFKTLQDMTENGVVLLLD